VRRRFDKSSVKSLGSTQSLQAKLSGLSIGMRETWNGDTSAVIGLQKRGLRGLMEGRRLRERGGSVGPQTNNQGQRVGLGIGGAGA